MKNWKSAVVTWEKRDMQDKPQSNSTNKFNQFPQREYSTQDYVDLEKKLINRRE